MYNQISKNEIVCIKHVGIEVDDQIYISIIQECFRLISYVIYSDSSALQARFDTISFHSDQLKHTKSLWIPTIRNVDLL